MPFTSFTQADFSVGIYRGRKAPDGAVFDLVNGLISDEGLPFKRGGSALLSTGDAGTNLVQLYDLFLQPGQRTVMISTSAAYALSGTTPVTLASGVSITTLARAVGIGGALVIPIPVGGTALYAGSLKTNAYITGTVSVTNGSKTVTGTGTAWTANADVGMILEAGSPTSYGIVAAVNGNTQLTLREPWPGATNASASYILTPATLGPGSVAGADPHLAAVGASPRLVVAAGNRAYLSPRGPVFEFDDGEYIELPASTVITGAAAFGRGLALFTNEGMWGAYNLDLDPVDAFGNIQWSQELLNGDLILWGDTGLANYGGALVVPAVDDVFLVPPGEAPIPVTAVRGDRQDAGIRSLYRSYVEAGYQPGIAAVFRGHYFLPVLNGTTLVDVLVCRLDRGFAWTRWSGHAASPSYAVRTGSTTRSPKLLGLAGQRVTDLTGCFTPATTNAADADSTVPDFTLITRDYPIGQQPGLVAKIRARYELTDDGNSGTTAPAVTPAFSSDQDSGSFTTLTDTGQQGGGTGWGTSDGSKYQWAIVGKRRERIRFRFTQAGAAGSFILRAIELLIRPQGRQ